MTISSTTRKAGPFPGTGAVVGYPFAFKVFATSDVLAVVADVATGVETELTEDVDYTVVLNADQDVSPGGTLTPLVALAVGKTLVLSSDVPLTQGVEVTNSGGFYPKVFNDALDRLTIFSQQLAEKISRSLLIPITATAGGSELIPIADGVIRWNPDGDAIVSMSFPEFVAEAALEIDPITFASAVTAAQATSLQIAQNLSDLQDKALARTNLGGTTIGKGIFTAADVAAVRTLLALGTAALANTGTGVGQVLAFTSAAQLPALDGVNLTNVVANPNLLLNAQAGAYSLVVGDRGKAVTYTGSADVTWGTLAAATAGNGWWTIIDNQGSGTITLDPNASENVNTRATILVYPGERFILRTPGTNWFTLGRQKQRVLVETKSPSGSGQVDFEKALADTEAASLEFEFDAVTFTVNAQMQVRFKQAGAYVTTTSYFFGGIASSGTSGNTASPNGYISTVTAPGVTGDAKLLSPFATGTHMPALISNASLHSSSDVQTNKTTLSSAGALQGVRLIANATTFSGGTVRCYINRE